MGVALSWLRANKVAKLYTAPKPVQLSIRSEHGIDKMALSELLAIRCPAMFEDFSPPLWLNSGHLQTAYCVFGDFSKIDKVVYDRKMLRLKDGGTIGLDFTPPTLERDLPDSTPIIVIMHGLTGGSHESYVRAILANAVRPRENGGLGYRAIVINFRGCAGVPLTSGQLYSAGHTDDLRQALIYISKHFPGAPLLGVGFSLGANVIVRYLSEEGQRSRLRAGCVLGCPWDLLKNSNRLEGTMLLRHVYSKGMGNNLVNLMKRNANAVLRIPDNPLIPIMMELFSLKSPKLIDVDSRLTSVAGGSSPPFPFPSARDYYIWASSHHCLSDIRVPLLAVNAADDPIVQHVPYDVGNNGFVALVVTSGGGHLGWFEAGHGFGEVRRWITRPTLEWLKLMGDEFVPEPHDYPEIVEEDGWTQEVGCDHLGFRELGDFGRVEGAEGEGFFQGL